MITYFVGISRATVCKWLQVETTTRGGILRSAARFASSLVRRGKIRWNWAHYKKLDSVMLAHQNWQIAPVPYTIVPISEPPMSNEPPTLGRVLSQPLDHIPMEWTTNRKVARIIWSTLGLHLMCLRYCNLSWCISLSADWITGSTIWEVYLAPIIPFGPSS